MIEVLAASGGDLLSSGGGLETWALWERSWILAGGFHCCSWSLRRLPGPEKEPGPPRPKDQGAEGPGAPATKTARNLSL